MKMARAGDLESTVFDQLKMIFKNPAMIVKTWKTVDELNGGLSENDVREGLQSIEVVWDHLHHGDQARLLQLLVMASHYASLRLAIRKIGRNLNPVQLRFLG